MKNFSSNRDAIRQLPKLGDGEIVSINGRPARVTGGTFRFLSDNSRHIPRNVDGDTYKSTATGFARAAN